MSQFNKRVACCSSMISKTTTEPFLRGMITSDKIGLQYSYPTKTSAKRENPSPNQDFFFFYKYVHRVQDPVAPRGRRLQSVTVYVGKITVKIVVVVGSMLHSKKKVMLFLRGYEELKTKTR